VPLRDFPLGFSELLRLDASQSLKATGLVAHKVTLTTRAGLIYRRRPAPQNSWQRPGPGGAYRTSQVIDPMPILVDYAKANLLPLAVAMSERWNRDLPRLLRLDPFGSKGRDQAVDAVSGRLIVTMDLTSPHEQTPRLVEAKLVMTHRDGRIAYLSRFVAGNASFDPDHPQSFDQVLSGLRDSWYPLRQLIAEDLEELYLPLLARIPRSR
jgi:hypothetical protein